MRQSAQPIVPDAPPQSEATQLLQSLEQLTVFLGDVYGSLAGHAAASRQAVSDLQGSLACLHSRCHPNTTLEPWLASSKAARTRVQETDNSQGVLTPPDSANSAQTAPAARQAARAVLPQAPPYNKPPQHQPTARPAPSATTQHPPSAPSSGGSEVSGSGQGPGEGRSARPQPQLQTAPQRPGGPGGVSRGGTRAMSTGRSAVPVAVAGRGVQAGGSRSSGAAAHPPARTASGPNPSPGRLPARASRQGQGSSPCPTPSQDIFTDLGLPRAVRQAGAPTSSPDLGQAGRATFPNQVAPQPQEMAPAPPQLPQLPPSFRRAVQQYNEAVQRGERMVLQGLRPGGQSMDSGRLGAAAELPGPGQAHGQSGSCDPACGLQKLVTQAGNHYTSSLHLHCQQLQQAGQGLRSEAASRCGPGWASVPSMPSAAVQPGALATGRPGQDIGGSSSSSSSSSSSAAVLQQQAQVLYATLIAAQTWLVQALGEVAAHGRTSSGVSLASVQQLVADVQQLRQQYDQMQQRADQAAAGEGEGLGPEVVSGGSGGTAERPAGVQGQGEEGKGDGEEEEREAIRWRNRFLRALAAQEQQQQQPQQQQGPRGAAAGLPGLQHGQQGRAGAGSRGPAAAHSLAALYGGVQTGPRQGLPPPPPSHPPLTPPSASSGREGPPGRPRAVSSLLMDRPLGVWLPDQCWQLLQAPSPVPGADEGGERGHDRVTPSSTVHPLQHQLSSDPSVIFQSAPWLRALPPAHVLQLQQRLDLLGPMAVFGGRVLQLQSPDPPHAMSHLRSQLQLQLHLLQLWLESQAAAGLLPDAAEAQAALLLLNREHAGDRRRSARDNGRVASDRAQKAAGAAPPEVKRLLARLRLAHTFLVKNAWNKACCVAERTQNDAY